MHDTSQPLGKSKYAWLGYALLGTCGLGALGFSLWLGSQVVSKVVDAVQMQSWVQASATIESTSLRRVVDRGGSFARKSARPTVSQLAQAEYAYTFEGRVHHGNTVSLYPLADDFGSFQTDAYAFLERHRQAGSEVPCYVNPADPQQSILFRELRIGLLLIELLGLGLGLTATIVAILMLRGLTRGS